MPRTYNFGVQVTDDVGATAQRSFSIDVNNSDYDRFAKVTQSGIARSKDGITWQFDASATNKGDWIFWARDRWILIDGLSAGQVIKQSFDLRSWQTVTLTTTLGWYPTCFEYVPELDRLYMASFNGTGETQIEYIPSFSTVGATATGPVTTAFPATPTVNDYIVGMTVNPVTGVVLVTGPAAEVLWRVTPAGAALNLSSTQGVYGFTWQNNGVLIAFNQRDGAFLFRLSFDDGLSWIDKSPTGLTPAVTSGARPFAYVNGVFVAQYQQADATQVSVWTTDLGDTWTTQTTTTPAPSLAAITIPLAYNNRLVYVDDVDVIAVWSGNLANTFLGSTNLGRAASGLGGYGSFAAVRVEVL